MLILGYIGVLLAGISLGLIGGGGSILIVPVLVYLFGVSPSLSTAYSLFVVGFASIVGAFRYAQKNLVDYKTAAVFAMPAFVGVYSARRFLVPSLPSEVLQVAGQTLTKDGLIMSVFAIVMLFASFSMIKSKPLSESEEPQLNKDRKYNYKMIGLELLGVGVVTGFVGAGGGFLIIPALVFFAKLPMKLAVGTSLVIISINSLLGFLGDLSGDQVIDWKFLLFVTLVAIVGIFVGSHLSQRIPGKKLQPAFGWFVLVMGTYILLRQFV